MSLFIGAPPEQGGAITTGAGPSSERGPHRSWSEIWSMFLAAFFDDLKSIWRMRKRPIKMLWEFFKLLFRAIYALFMAALIWTGRKIPILIRKLKPIAIRLGRVFSKLTRFTRKVLLICLLGIVVLFLFGFLGKWVVHPIILVWGVAIIAAIVTRKTLPKSITLRGRRVKTDSLPWIPFLLALLFTLLYGVWLVWVAVSDWWRQAKFDLSLWWIFPAVLTIILVFWLIRRGTLGLGWLGWLIGIAAVYGLVLLGVYLVRQYVPSPSLQVSGAYGPYWVPNPTVFKPDHHFTSDEVPGEVALPIIAKCESGGRQFENDGVTPYKNRGIPQKGIPPSTAFGKLQFLESHRAEAAKLGFDLNTEKGQNNYFGYRYVVYGTKDWEFDEQYGGGPACWGDEFQKIAVARGKRMPVKPGEIDLKYVEVELDSWSEPLSIGEYPTGSKVFWDSVDGKSYKFRRNGESMVYISADVESGKQLMPDTKLVFIEFSAEKEKTRVRVFVRPKI